MTIVDEIKNSYTSHVLRTFGETAGNDKLPAFLAFDGGEYFVITANCVRESEVCALLKAAEVYAYQTGKEIRVGKPYLELGLSAA